VDLVPGPDSSDPTEPVALGGHVVFAALGQVWTSDGTEPGTASLAYAGSGASSLTRAGNLVYYRTDAAPQLWRTDGIPGGGGTFALYPPVVPQSPQELAAVGSTLFFTARRSTTGRELWKSDGTVAGTVLVKDIRPGPADSTPRHLTDVAGTLYFWAADGVTGWELWKSDGTDAGTMLVRDIDPTDVTVPSFLTAVGPLLYFTANTPSFGRELWRSDGTQAGTFLVSNINLDKSAYPEDLVDVGGTLFFYAEDGRTGEELWALTPCGDGTRDPGEECDDGNVAPGDGCAPTCRWEAACGGPTSCVGGRRLRVRDARGLGVTLVARDAAIAPFALGSAADPLLHGGMLEVRNPATGEATSFALPPAGWSARAAGGRLSWRYTDRARAGCRRVVLKAGRLDVRCGGAQGGLTLDEPAQGSLTVRLTAGAASALCLRFGGTVARDQPAGAAAGVFAARDAPVPASCR
jgi:ELWxxDGT repeat protein/cysteine-rich repeat protein